MPWFAVSTNAPSNMLPGSLIGFWFLILGSGSKYIAFAGSLYLWVSQAFLGAGGAP